MGRAGSALLFVNSDVVACWDASESIVLHEVLGRIYLVLHPQSNLVLSLTIPH